MARGLVGAAELRTQRRVLAEIAHYPGLDEKWRELLPRTLAFDERNDATVSVESYRPGIELEKALASDPHRAEQLIAAALSAIAPLHRHTATFVVVDDVCLLGRWVVEPLAGVKHMCRRLAPGRVAQLDRLESMLRCALVGRRMSMSWTHGHYTPGNVRVAGVDGPVTGIVNWGRARAGRPAVIDEYLMALTATCQVQRAELGTIVSDRLRAGGLAERERNALRAARGRSDTGMVAERVEERIAILLAWLHHAGDSWRKPAHNANQRTWWATTVAPVLDAVAASGDSGQLPADRAER